jgi:hypothetical protein
MFYSVWFLIFVQSINIYYNPHFPVWIVAFRTKIETKAIYCKLGNNCNDVFFLTCYWKLFLFLFVLLFCFVLFLFCLLVLFNNINIVSYIYFFCHQESLIWNMVFCFSIIASKTCPNGIVIWSIRQWRHWMSICESEKRPYIWELDVLHIYGKFTVG